MSLILPGCSVKITHEYRNKYNIDVYYTPEQRSIYGIQKLAYRNTENVDIDSLFFHIYANAYLNSKTVPIIGGIEDNYPRGFNPGQIDIKNILINNKPVKWRILGDDKTLLMVTPDKPIKKGGKVEVEIDFQERLPEAKTCFGYIDGIASFDGWYPLLCVYDENGWHKEPSCTIGEVNFSEVSDYKININLPENEVVASSGECIDEKKEDDRKIITLKADNIRDFTWISSNKFKMVEKKFNNITIKSYFIDDHKAAGLAAQDFGVKAISLFSDSFGGYLYDSYSIVETGMELGAANYPKLTALGQYYYKNSDIKVMEDILAYETAHQWWYATIGNNEYMEPWLDESLSSYSEAMYVEKYYGSKAMKDKINNSRSSEKTERSMGDSIDKFKNTAEYNLVVHIKGAYNLYLLREEIGNNEFLNILKKYYADNKNKNVRKEDFLKVVYEVSGSKAVETFEKCLGYKD